MRTIWKFPLSLGITEVSLPCGAGIALVGVQEGGALCLWAEVESQSAAEVRRFRVFGTGRQVPGGWRHVGTVVDRSFVWHVYEEVA